MKLYDRILHDGFLWPSELRGWVKSKADGPAMPQLKEIMGRAVGVNIRNVADYRYARLDAGDTVTMPNVRLPWPVAWFEWGFDIDGNEGEYGVLSAVTGVPGPDAPNDPSLSDDWKAAAETQQHSVFVRNRALAVPVFIGCIETLVSHDGALLNFMEAEGDGVASKAQVVSGPGLDEEEALMGLEDALNSVRLAITFAHCKNVALQDHHTPPKVAAKRKKAGKPIGTSYKTLLIDPMKETLRTEGGIEKNGLKKALHICRGHFATYTDDKPLFGKVTGTFWKPMHVRGSKERGEVKKDYVIGAPNP